MASYYSYEDVYTKETIKILEEEFSRLNGLAYLDHTGSTLYADSQIKAVFEDLRQNTYGNPHSLSLCSKICQDSIDLIRYRILNHFHTNYNEYSVVFTSGATSALKLLAETFDFTGSREKHEIDHDDQVTSFGVPDYQKEFNESSSKIKNGTFVYLNENHTSVIGMREAVISRGASMRYITVPELQECFDKGAPQKISSKIIKNSLFAYPAQSNFSGLKYPLNWIEGIQKGILNSTEYDNPSNWFCLLDAATFVSTNDLNLSCFKPDFVCISFYKIFGYPTGLGALLIKNSSAYVLKKGYFGGGSVSLSLSNKRFHIPKPRVERFEDGTIPFLSILSIQHGFNTFYKLVGNVSKVTMHTFNLSQYFYRNLKQMQHDNGQPVAKVYCDTNYDDVETQGNIVNFNLLRSNGSYVGYTEVLQMANLHNIHLRTGCFCNPGACQRHLGLTDQELLDNYEAGHVCGDTVDLVNGKPTGSVRISFGYMSTRSDADRLLSMIESCFKERNLSALTVPCKGGLKVEESLKKRKLKENVTLPANVIDGIENFHMSKHFNPAERFAKPVIRHIFLYPIKSCGAFKVQRWSLGPRGLLHDRQWMVVNSAGVCMTQKREPRLCMIQPFIDLENGELRINYPGMQEITIPLNIDDDNSTTSIACQSKVCGDKVQVIDCGDGVAEWLTTAFRETSLGDLRLHCQSSYDDRRCFKSNNMKSVKGDEKELSLSNQAQFLLINSASIKWLSDRVEKEMEGLSYKEDDLMNRFRANFVVECQEAFTENTWNYIKIGNITFQSEGPCTRCQMICIDQTTGKKTKEPLSTISRLFNGKSKFGVYLSQIYPVATQYISVGDEVEEN